MKLALLYREWHMLKWFILIGSMMIILLYGFSMDSLLSFDGRELLTFGLIMPPLIVLFSLNLEANQLAVFLHHPQSAHTLYIVKITFATFIVMLFMYFIIFIDLLKSVLTEESLHLISLNYMYLSMYAFCYLSISLFITTIIILLWTLHQVWRTYIGKFSLIIIVLILIGSSNLFTAFQNTSLYNTMIKWGAIKIPLSNPLSAEDFFNKIFYIGEWLLYGGIAIIFYMISVYLFERKVEAS
ncbi:MAG TPA: hypothetical protein VIG73_13315 [Cerasibacillus sp.]|uniref:hypothetical protein n=1 Tax=Cerasibacillus sp. TaxID=2498711 RepID=UPI002F3E408F